ncbi:MAG: hypothetical protein EAZ85_08960 [Bacteroidetes bacterium]|nr:MAG: hypothetical protein EAZ85_08960 [Bacteroidota bacterium]TAG93881.1 MAG: hypothetical protein EAZ20_01340 [Bacteroidota bacterium]
MKKIFIFGNGNLSFDDFLYHYYTPIQKELNNTDTHFIICDFRGTDTLLMELLKTKTDKVSVYHIGKKPRYMPDKYKTLVEKWRFIGGFETDEQRDEQAIKEATHFLAVDFNSDENRKSGTQKNIEKLIAWQKIEIK